MREKQQWHLAPTSFCFSVSRGMDGKVTLGNLGKFTTSKRLNIRKKTPPLPVSNYLTVNFGIKHLDLGRDLRPCNVITPANRKPLES